MAKKIQTIKQETMCPSCKVNECIYDDTFGVTFCKKCREKEEDVPQIGYEFTSESIKNQRLEYRKDILQPFHGNTVSKEYIEEYGTQGITATKEQIKNARYTYKGIKGWWNRTKSKGGRSR